MQSCAGTEKKTGIMGLMWLIVPLSVCGMVRKGWGWLKKWDIFSKSVSKSRCVRLGKLCEYYSMWCTLGCVSCVPTNRIGFLVPWINVMHSKNVCGGGEVQLVLVKIVVISKKVIN